MPSVRCAVLQLVCTQPVRQATIRTHKCPVPRASLPVHQRCLDGPIDQIRYIESTQHPAHRSRANVRSWRIACHRAEIASNSRGQTTAAGGSARAHSVTVEDGCEPRTARANLGALPEPFAGDMRAAPGTHHRRFGAAGGAGEGSSHRSATQHRGQRCPDDPPATISIVLCRVIHMAQRASRTSPARLLDSACCSLW
jgi:hypothetical protein